MNITNEQFKEYVETYGGKNTGSVSKKTNYVVVGMEPGKKKISDAEDKGIEIIDTRHFWELVE